MGFAMTWLPIKVLIAYLLGSLMGTLIIGKLRGVDIRDLGSGNAGGTNALRTQGFAFAVPAVVIDVGKAMLAVWIGMHFWMDELPSPLMQGLTCGLACMLGHAYPIFFDLRGGKAASCLIGIVLLIKPVLLIPVLIVFVFTLLLTGYVGLGTILASLTLPIAAYWMVPMPARIAWVAFAAVAALMIVFFHRSNILRMWRHEEYRFEKVWLFGKRGRS